MTSQPPAINAPRIILFLSIIMIGIHILRVAAADSLAGNILLSFALIPVKFSHPGLLPDDGLIKYASFMTFSLLHADWTHLIVNAVTMLAFGSVAAWRLGGVRFIILCIACSIGGGLTHLITHWGDIVPVIGASAVVSGHMAVAVRFLDKANSFFLARGAHIETLKPLRGLEILKSRTALTFLSVWVLINIGIGLGGSGLDDRIGRIAWEAHLGGFFVGYFIFPYLDRDLAVNHVE